MFCQRDNRITLCPQGSDQRICIGADTALGNGNIQRVRSTAADQLFFLRGNEAADFYAERLLQNWPCHQCGRVGGTGADQNYPIRLRLQHGKGSSQTFPLIQQSLPHSALLGNIALKQ